VRKAIRRKPRSIRCCVAVCPACSLSSIATRRFENGKLAAERVLAALNSSVVSRAEQIDLAFALITRESTAI
ncbi:hypothetical protein ACC754_36995, partial [Rhizobium johnstonii]